jgi:hypothetical protein
VLVPFQDKNRYFLDENQQVTHTIIRIPKLHIIKNIPLKISSTHLVPTILNSRGKIETVVYGGYDYAD